MAMEDPSALGQAVAAPQHNVVAGPPASPEEFESRRQGFVAYLSDPRIQAALMQFGTALAQPRSVLQSDMGHLTSSLSQGAAAAGRVETEQQRVREKGAELDVQNRQVDVQNRNADTNARQARTQEGQLEESIRSNTATQEETAQSNRNKESLEGRRIAADEDRVDIYGEQVRVMEAQLALEQQKENNDAGVRKATENLLGAQAEEARARARNPGGGAQLAQTQALAQALQLQNPGMAPAEAHIKATEALTQLGAKPRADKILEVYKTLADNALGKDVDHRALTQQATAIVDQIEGIEPKTGGGTPPPQGVAAPAAPPIGEAPAATGVDITRLDPAVQQLLNPITSAGGQVLGMEYRTNGRGQKVPIYRVQDANGNTGFVKDPRY